MKRKMKSLCPSCLWCSAGFGTFTAYCAHHYEGVQETTRGCVTKCRDYKPKEETVNHRDKAVEITGGITTWQTKDQIR